MSILISVIAREETRNENMISQYLKELENLPKGKITPKVIKGKTYFYLYFRHGKKVISKYIGNDEAKIRDYKEKLERRRQIEDILKKLKDEKIKIKKMKAILWFCTTVAIWL